jgi:hypothetical protein
MSLFKIPLSPTPQTFQIALAGREYSMTCKYNSAEEGGWVLDFADAETAEPIVANIPLITGADVLSGLEYLGFGGSLFVYTDGDQNAVPTLENLGVESNLYFETED